MSGKHGVTKLVFKKGYLRELRNTVEVRDKLKEVAGKIAKAAEAASPEGAEYEVDSQRVSNNGKRLSTARASVRTANYPAILAEATDRTLTKSLGAGRD